VRLCLGPMDTGKGGWCPGQHRLAFRKRTAIKDFSIVPKLGRGTGQPVWDGQRGLVAEDFVDFFSELKIEIADALDAVGIEVDDDLVPHVEPFGVVIHPFRD